VGTSNGNLIQLAVVGSEVLIQKTHKVDKQPVISIQANQEKKQKLFVLTERSLNTCDKKSLQVQLNYEIPQKILKDSEDDEEQFQVLSYSKFGDSNASTYSIGCFLLKKMWLLLFEPENQVCYGVKDLSHLAINKIEDI